MLRSSVIITLALLGLLLIVTVCSFSPTMEAQPVIRDRVAIAAVSLSIFIFMFPSFLCVNWRHHVAVRFVALAATYLASCQILLILKNLPRDPITLLPIRAEERGLVLHGGFPGAVGEGVVFIGLTDDAFLQLLDLLPAEGDSILGTLGRFDGVVGALVELLLVGLACQADADEALAGGEDDAAVLVVPGVGLVLAHHRELHAVDGEQFFQGETEGLGNEDVDFHQGLAAGVVAAQGAMTLPLGGQFGEEVPGQGAVGDMIAGRPLLLAEGVLPV